MVGNYMVDLSNLPTDLLVKELENRRETGDVLFAAVYTKEIIKDRICETASMMDIGLGTIDKLADTCFDAIDKESLQQCYNEWSKGDDSVYGKILEEVDFQLND